MKLGALVAARFAIAAAYSLAVATVMIKAGEPTEFWWWFISIPFFLWCLAPVVLPLSHPSWIVAFGVGVMAAFSSYVYVTDMFGPGARSTSALIFIFLPIYQWIAVGALLGLDLLVRRALR